MKTLHHGPPGYENAGSFKTRDHSGNLHLSFFTNGKDWRADIDIEDAKGLEAADGRAAKDLLDTGTRIDLILSNVMLPHIDGFTLFLHVRRHHPRILFVTAIYDAQVQEATRREGAAGYTLKPFGLEDFLAVVRNVLTVKHELARTQRPF